MDCVDSYFDFLFVSACGIPEITLQGEKRDWELLVEKTKALAKFEMDWWLRELVPVLQEFVHVFDGNVKTDFWKHFVNIDNSSGGPYFTGHMTKLSAYKATYSSPPSGTTSRPWVMPQGGFAKVEVWHNEKDWCIGWTTKDFSTGLSQVPFVWQYLDQTFSMTFASGFVGIEIVDGTAFRPNISWAVLERDGTATDPGEPGSEND